MFDEEKEIRQVLDGDVKAFENIVQQYEKLVFSILNRLLDNRQDVEDVGQDIFIKVFRGLSGFKFQSKLSTWIARIAYHTGINYLKKNNLKQSYYFEEVLDDFYFTEDTPELKLQNKELHLYINELIDGLPLQYKTVINLYHYNDFSYKEVATVTGLPEGTIKGYLFRARKILKEKLEVYGNR